MARYNVNTQPLPQHALSRKRRALAFGWCLVLGILLGLGGHRSLAARGVVPVLRVDVIFLDNAARDVAPGNMPASSGVPASDSVTTPDDAPAPAYATGGENGSLLLGNPSEASHDPNNYLLEKPQYSFSYNCANGTPNWVAWHLSAGDLGNEGRGRTLPDPDYHADPVLRADWQISPLDYAQTSSRYDRGHLCPSADRSDRRENNDATFAMTNIAPQTAALNRGVWASLEKQCRTWVRAGSELYIVSGGVGSQERIAGGRISVPAAYWKIILILPQGENDLARITATTEVVSVLIPNNSGALDSWERYRTSVTQIEGRTGYNFFSALPSEVRLPLKVQVESNASSAESDASAVQGEGQSEGEAE